MPTRLMERDIRILRKCACARWLTTSQIKRYFFAETHIDVARHRLQKLVRDRFLRSHQPHRAAETLYAVGPAGRRVLEEHGLRFALERHPPALRAHLVGINDVRLAVERGGASVVYFFGSWELGHVGGFEKLVPDAAFCIELGRRIICMVEYDRGTEYRQIFAKKVQMYRYYPRIAFDAVLVIAGTPGRLESLGRYLRSKTREGAVRLLGTTIDEVRNVGVYARTFSDLMRSSEQRYALGDLAHEAASRDRRRES